MPCPVVQNCYAAVANRDMSRLTPSAGVYAVFAPEAFFAAHRAFAAVANFFFVAGLIGFRASFTAGDAAGAALADFFSD